MVMKPIGVAELKAHLSEYLRAVRRGHEVTVLDRDRPIARLVPITGVGPMAIREPGNAYGTLGDIPLPAPAQLGFDAVEVLLEERRRDE